MTVAGQVGETAAGAESGPVAVDGSYNGSTEVTLPQQSGTNSYYLIYSANDNRGLFESNYANNQMVFGPVTTVLASSFTLGTTTRTEGPGAGSDSVLIALAAHPATNAWFATTGATWLHLGAGNQSGTGSTNVVFITMPIRAARASGTLTIAGQTLTVYPGRFNLCSRPCACDHACPVASGLSYPPRRGGGWRRQCLHRRRRQQRDQEVDGRESRHSRWSLRANLSRIRGGGWRGQCLYSPTTTTPRSRSGRRPTVTSPRWSPRD